MHLYDYYRSTASYRVRIALNIKNISYDSITIHLLNNGGQQHSPDYMKINPQQLVPTLDENGHIISQSLAIIDYLEEISPTPALLPATPYARAKVRSLALMIACDLHPLNCLRVINQLRDQFKASEDQITTWMHHWFKLSFDALEKSLLSYKTDKSLFCYGHVLSLADVCLIPQIYSAERFKFSLTPYPRMQEINEHCLTIPAFQKASPLNQSES